MAEAVNNVRRDGGALQIAVKEYLENGWVLCPITEGSKVPSLQGWNRIENAITRPDQMNLITGNVGLLHAFSNTAAIDVDNVELATPFLMDHGIDLGALLADSRAVLIDSGRSNHCKLLYQQINPLQYQKLASQGLELRCADASGGSVQDVLPPSIHPLGKPYRWAGNGHYSKLPKLPQNLLKFWLNRNDTKPPINTQSITEGSRNITLASMGGALRHAGKDLEEITGTLLAANNAQCIPPLFVDEVTAIARSVSKYDIGDGIDEVGAIEDGASLVPPGNYLVRYVRHKIMRNMHGWGPKIVIWFGITQGDYQGAIVRAFYNIEVEGRKWWALPGSRPAIELTRLFPSARKDRISPAMLRDHDILARVGTEKKGTYSIIKELLELRE